MPGSVRPRRINCWPGRRTQASPTELDQARAQAAKLREDARLERERLAAQAAAEQVAAEQQTERRLRTAEEDFEITLRGRRTQAEQEDAAARATAAAEAERLISDAAARAAELALEQERTRQQLHELYDRLGAVLGATAGLPGPSKSAR